MAVDLGPGRVFFAGEHTHPDYSGTVHGAYWTGVREAQRIAASFAWVVFDMFYSASCIIHRICFDFSLLAWPWLDQMPVPLHLTNISYLFYKWTPWRPPGSCKPNQRPAVDDCFDGECDSQSMSNADCAPSRLGAEPGFAGDENKDGDAVEVIAEVATAEEYEDELERSRGGCSRILSKSCWPTVDALLPRSASSDEWA
jgi:hypothetical protein